MFLRICISGGGSGTSEDGKRREVIESLEVPGSGRQNKCGFRVFFIKGKLFPAYKISVSAYSIIRSHQGMLCGKQYGKEQIFLQQEKCT